MNINILTTSDYLFFVRCSLVTSTPINTTSLWSKRIATVQNV